MDTVRELIESNLHKCCGELITRDRIGTLDQSGIVAECIKKVHELGSEPAPLIVERMIEWAAVRWVHEHGG